MSQTILSLIAAVRRGEVRWFVRVNEGKREAGKPAFRAFLAHMERCYRERLDGIVLMASEDGLRGAAEFTVHGEYLATDEGLPEAKGQTYVLPAGAFFGMADGKICAAVRTCRTRGKSRQTPSS